MEETGVKHEGVYMDAQEIQVDLTDAERGRLAMAASRLEMSPEALIQTSVNLFVSHPDAPMRDGRPDWDRIIRDTVALSMAAAAMVEATDANCVSSSSLLEPGEVDEGGAAPAAL